jgi:arylsulfatase A-like enzyme
MYPSLCELCGLPIPEHTEGTSFVPLLEDANRDWKAAAFSQYPRRGGDVMGTTMRTDRYRYTEWRDTGTDEVLARELYDHQKDPQENVNLAVQADYASLIDALAAQMEKGWQGAKPNTP